MAVISWQRQNEDDDKPTGEPVSASEAMRRIRATRDSVTSNK